MVRPAAVTSVAGRHEGPPTACIRRIALLFAVRQEMAPLARRLRPSREDVPPLRGYPMLFGEIAGRQVLLAAAGIGARRAAAAAEAVLDAWKPDLLLMTGVAGALSPDLQVGDLILANAVLTEVEQLHPSFVFPHTHTPTHPHTHTGPLLSLDRILITAKEKHAAFTTPPPHDSTTAPPLVVEMETAAAARVAMERGVPWAAIRAVSDTANESLPLDFNALRTADGELPTSRVAVAALRNPRCIPGLLRLGRNTSTASEALACFLAGWVASLPAADNRGG